MDRANEAIADAASAAVDRPSWITDELIALTLKIFQPFYAVCLTVQDAADIILNASRLMSSITWQDRRLDTEAAGV